MKKFPGIFLSVLFVLQIFCGCVTRSFSRNVINEVGIDNISRFQFYLSSRIKLNAAENILNPNIDDKGAAKITETAYRDIIIIDMNAMGALMDMYTDDDGLLILEICFEAAAEDGDKRIIFKQGGPGPEQYFYISYKDPVKKILDYGDREYSLKTRTDKLVYLNVRHDKKQIDKDRVRRAKGRRAGD